MADILQNLLAKSDLLLVFAGMAILLWKALDALSTLAHLLAGQQIAPGKLSGTLLGSVLPKPAASPSETPAPSAGPKTIVLDQAMVDAVKKFEGYEPKAKWDYKQYTNGYGTKAQSSDETVSEAEAERRLIDELGKALAAVQAFVPANTPIGVEQGLTSATFNLGTAWMKAGLGTAVKAGDWTAAKEHLLQYNHAGGQVLDALTRRRQAEVSWFDHPL